MKKPITNNALQHDAMMLFQSGRYEEARALYEKICKRNPKDADAWFFLGIIHGQSGALAQSETCSRKATQLAPHSHAAWDNLGLSLMLQGKRTEAKKSFQRALQSNPRDEQAYNNLGTLLRDEGRLDEAIAHIRRSIELKPDYAEAFNNLGNMLHDRSQIREALACYERAIQIDPRYIDAYYNRGMAQQKMGLYDAALASYETVLRLSPGHVDAITGIANVHEKRSEYEAAHELLTPLIASDRMTVSGAMTLAATARRLGRHEEAIAVIDKLLTQHTNLPLVQQQELHFSLGSLCDDTKDYERAFKHFQKGNALRQYPDDPTSKPDHFTAIIETFSSDRMAGLARSTNTSERPIFIVGMPRSGTTLVEQILSSHPDVHGGGELRGIEDLIGPLCASTASQRSYPACAADLASADLDAAAQKYLQELTLLSPDKARVTDKMPHNFLHLGLIGMLFPRARIIHCTRDPLDTCLSIYFHNFNANHPYTTDLTALGEYYKQYQRLMHHWESVLDIKIHKVVYEELVADQESGTRALLDYCGLSWDPTCLRFHENKRVVTTPSYQQVRRPLYNTAVKRWKHYESHLKPLIEALGIIE